MRWLWQLLPCARSPPWPFSSWQPPHGSDLPSHWAVQQKLVSCWHGLISKLGTAMSTCTTPTQGGLLMRQILHTHAPSTSYSAGLHLDLGMPACVAHAVVLHSSDIRRLSCGWYGTPVQSGLSSCIGRLLCNVDLNIMCAMYCRTQWEP